MRKKWWLNDDVYMWILLVGTVLFGAVGLVLGMMKNARCLEWEKHKTGHLTCVHIGPVVSDCTEDYVSTCVKWKPEEEP